MTRCFLIPVFVFLLLSDKDSPIDGSWKRVSARYNGQEINVNTYIQIRFFSSGYFSVQSCEAGMKNESSGYGTFQLTNDHYTETFVYHSDIENIGATDWQVVQLNGDTLHTFCFKKVSVVDNLVKDFPMLEETYVRQR